MIKANELRIGNWVDTTTAGLNFGIQVSGIYDGNICFADGDIFDPKYIEPIPLTPEILEKCGFKKDDEWAFLYFPPRMGIRFYDFNYAECDIIQDDKFISFKNSHIKYLHQLQNIYFALTGEELKINLNVEAHQ